MCEHGYIEIETSQGKKKIGITRIHIEDDAFIEKSALSKLGVNKYLERDDVFLSPNMTYYPRVVRKEKYSVVNGSVAILIPKTEDEITNEHLKFFSSEEFEMFYKIARNYSTRSLNIDSNSVKFFGLYDKSL